MSQSVSILRSVGASPVVTAGQAVLSRLAGTIVIWLNHRQGRRDLGELDDRLLADVGISREDALWEAGRPFWRTEKTLQKAGEPLRRV
jgi:uncharacterized protein YjiS (DUF1127 family)